MGGSATIPAGRLRNTFSKPERLTSKKLMDELFRKGSSIVLEPVRLVWLRTELPAAVPVQTVFSVPKRSFPLAVHRNKIKRQLRESFRLHKHDLYSFLTDRNFSVALAVVYTGRKILSYAVVEQKIIVALNRLIQENEVR